MGELDMKRDLCLAAVALLAVGCTVTGNPTDSGIPPRPDATLIPEDASVVRDAGTDTGPQCEPGEIACSGVCTRVAADSENCGSCGVVCPEGVGCAAGRCNCEAPRISCDGVCLDPTSDPFHCGGCGVECGPLDMCVDGRCQLACSAPSVVCVNRGEDDKPFQVCADLQTDSANCGRCNTRCSGGSVCTEGRCACPPGQLVCGGRCVDPNSDPAHCGSCGIRCGEGGVCMAGACTTCGTGLTSCSGRCIDVQADRLNCGSCGRRCGVGEACAGGLCQCDVGRTDCGTGCTDLLTDVRNCGTCGTDCGPRGACEGGMCGCEPGWTLCGGSCRDLANDLANCGDCGDVCPPLVGGVCASGSCGCPTGLSDCDGTCVNTQFSTSNCGACGNVCPAGEACRAGVCEETSTFRVTSFGTTNCQTIQHDPPSGDDRGGIAVSDTHLFVTGDTATVRMTLDTLSGLSTVSPSRIHDGLLSDLSTGQVYVLLTATGQQPAGTFLSGTTTITQLGLLDGVTGDLTSTLVPLSVPIPLTNSSGVFAGYGGALIGVNSSGLQWWHIALPSGVVTRLGNTQLPTRRTCENWAWWGVAEFHGDAHHAVYVESSTRIARLTIPTTGTSASAPVAPVSTFTDLGDMCSITFSALQNRWYFHHEYDSQFSATPFGEIAGRCDGTWDRP